MIYESQSDFNGVTVIRTMNHRLVAHSVADNNWPNKYENIISKEPIKSRARARARWRTATTQRLFAPFIDFMRQDSRRFIIVNASGKLASMPHVYKFEKIRNLLYIKFLYFWSMVYLVGRANYNSSREIRFFFRIRMMSLLMNERHRICAKIATIEFQVIHFPEIYLSIGITISNV